MYASILSPICTTCFTSLKLGMWALDEIFLYLTGEYLGHAIILDSKVFCVYFYRHKWIHSISFGDDCLYRTWKCWCNRNWNVSYVGEFDWSLWTPQNILHAWIMSNLRTLDVKVYRFMSLVSPTQRNLEWFVSRTNHWWKNLYTVTYSVVVMNNRPLKNE